MAVDLLSCPHDVAKRCMFGCYPPRCEGECVHLLEVVVAGDVLLRDPKLGHRDERRQRLRPLDGDVLDWHPWQIGAQLDLDVEFIRAVPQFGYQRRAVYGGSGFLDSGIS